MASAFLLPYLEILSFFIVTRTREIYYKHQDLSLSLACLFLSSRILEATFGCTSLGTVGQASKTTARLQVPDGPVIVGGAALRLSSSCAHGLEERLRNESRSILKVTIIFGLVPIFFSFVLHSANILFRTGPVSVGGFDQHNARSGD